MVSTYLIRYPGRSLRGAENYLRIPRSSIYYVLSNDLCICSYKIHVVQHFEDPDYEARIQLANWRWQNIQTDELFLSLINYSDACVFHVDGNFKKHYVRVCGTASPHE